MNLDRRTSAPVELLTAQEVAEMLIVPVTTLYFWRRAGRGPQSFRIGKQLRYRADDVTAWLEERATPVSGDSPPARREVNSKEGA